MANKESDMFFFNHKIPSTELKFINKGTYNRVRDLVHGAFPPNSACAPEVRLDLEGERYNICVINKAAAHQFLIAREIEGHENPFDAYEHLIVRLGTIPKVGNASGERKQRPNMTNENHFSSTKESPSVAEWRDETGREAHGTHTDARLREDIKELAAVVYHDKGPIFSMENSKISHKKVVIHIYNAENERILKGKAFQRRRETMEHIIRELNIIKARLR